MIQTVGSVCSGIEAASVAWQPLGLSFQWFSEIAPFPSQVLENKFPRIMNLGDMNLIADMITDGRICAPDLICGGTPCQAFSMAGWKKGLGDTRGNLTLRFVDIIEANDRARVRNGLEPCTVFWENVEGVLTDKTNAFGCLISSLAGLDEVFSLKKWPSAGAIHGRVRNVAWRVLDAKYFGLPQQRRRLYVLAGGRDFYPENVLFEVHEGQLPVYPQADLRFTKEGHYFEVFREYSDCLYAAYATKWNGNAAAYNGSLFVVQDGRIRRLSPLECERLMGFPDNYTGIPGARRTNRYQAIGNSWAVPVVRWIGQRLLDYTDGMHLEDGMDALPECIMELPSSCRFYDFGQGLISVNRELTLNCTAVPENAHFASLKDILSADAPASIYISPVGCQGILRRKQERHASMNPRLEEILAATASEMPPEEIERKSLVQHRGKYSMAS